MMLYPVYWATVLSILIIFWMFLGLYYVRLGAFLRGRWLWRCYSPRGAPSPEPPDTQAQYSNRR